jgi:hypothetical protein
MLPAPTTDFEPILDARADNCPATDPHVRADFDRLAKLLLAAKFSVHQVGRCVNLDGRAELRKVADFHLAHIENDAVEVEKDPLSKNYC